MTADATCHHGGANLIKAGLLTDHLLSAAAEIAFETWWFDSSIVIARSPFYGDAAR
jgi:hypothetical protein